MGKIENDRIEDILEAIKKTEDELNPEIKGIIRDKIQSHSKDDIYGLLNTILDESPGEDGGKNALTGFYFQLLCTLYYLAEVIEGKWDFLVLELHQDIIVGNESTIRFIQVKSEVSRDRNLSKEVTQTELYTGGWVQKLISMARLFPKGEGIKTEFELITNFIITNSSRVKVGHYLYNREFGQDVFDDDDLLEKVTEFKTRGLSENFSYEDSCNESIKELLSRFRINPKNVNVDNLDDFIGAISSKLGRLIHDSASVSFSDINYLLGELCFKCNHSNQGSLMYIDKEKAFEYLEVLKQRVSSNLEGFIATTNNNRLIDEIVTKINESYKELQDPLKNQMFDELEQFRNYLKEWINEDFSMFEMVHRYLEGKPFSLKLNTMPSLKFKEKAEEIFKTLFILKVLLDEEINFSEKFKGILIKEANNFYVSLVGLDFDQTMEEGLEKLKSILEKATDEEKILILMQNNHTIFQGDYDDEDITERKTLDVKEIIKVANEHLSQEKSVKDVDYQWTIIPGKKFTTFLRKVKRYEDIFSFKDDVQDKLEVFLK
ncbi:dsDNA nuclease domain-containing protein [Halobacillus litoralis]|uniref:dsDNA nuclease domain-containing protein n=1 Tax=Halobacillus litoralis TaxID=45668 RepID=UPI00248FC0D8|nr:dsDNA nuclease domain-containing protein [Halobacillus litoralis]